MTRRIRNRRRRVPQSSCVTCACSTEAKRPSSGCNPGCCTRFASVDLQTIQLPATISWIMLSSQSRERSSRGRRTVARDLHHDVDVAGQREAERVECRFRLLGERRLARCGRCRRGGGGVDWRSTGIFWWQGSSREPENQERVTKSADFCGQQRLHMSATAVTPRPLLYFPCGAT